MTIITVSQFTVQDAEATVRGYVTVEDAVTGIQASARAVGKLQDAVGNKSAYFYTALFRDDR